MSPPNFSLNFCIPRALLFKSASFSRLYHTKFIFLTPKRFKYKYIAGLTNYKNGECNPLLSNDELILIKKYRKFTERSKGKHDILLDQLIEQQFEEQAKVKDIV